MKWDIVRIGVRCAYGCEMKAGERGLFVRRGFVLCVTHALKYPSVPRPPRGMKKKHQQLEQDEANARDGYRRRLSEKDQ